ncbi:unnamed protein product [Cyprideis torosa]|uniref:Uncharacterized protein n=1 Tax=Cyprideis torosa TaxID=163714 RepID=A0A7R8ZHQ8_9CRUS|nr:unnamed protein product [Cyprideis torosa]CAG0884298.1 unnamed protein product [Cyprideis torosa]
MFIAVFKRFSEYQIFWKWETEHMDDLPSNVMLSKWMPQQDLLGHSDCKLFITHGGLLSTQEATYHGVPVVGIGIGIDQMTNMKKTESMGAGIALEWNKLTEDQLVTAIERVLRDPSVANRSLILRDQPETPLDRAAFWTEFVIKHRGAPHLRSAGGYLTW